MALTADHLQEPSVSTEAFSTHGTLVRLAGEFDLANAAQIGNAVETEISHGHRHLVIDLGATTFLDCATIGTLLRAVSPLRLEPDAAIVLAGPTGTVKRLLDLLQLDRLFDIASDVDEAIRRATARDQPHIEGWRNAHPKALAAHPPGTEPAMVASTQTAASVENLPPTYA